LQLSSKHAFIKYYIYYIFYNAWAISIFFLKTNDFYVKVTKTGGLPKQIKLTVE